MYLWGWVRDSGSLSTSKQPALLGLPKSLSRDAQTPEPFHGLQLSPRPCWGAGGHREQPGLGARLPPPWDGSGRGRHGAAQTCAQGETRQTRAEVQEKVYWSTEATHDPLPEWGGCPDPPSPRPSPSPPPVAAPALWDRGFGAGTSQTRHPHKKMLNSWGLAALRDRGTPFSLLSPSPEQRMGEREGGALPNHPHSRYPGWGGS